MARAKIFYSQKPPAFSICHNLPSWLQHFPHLYMRTVLIEKFFSIGSISNPRDS